MNLQIWEIKRIHSCTCLDHNNHFLLLVWHFKFCRRRGLLYFTVNDSRSWPDNSGTNVSSEQRSQICWKTRQTSPPRWAHDEIWPEFLDLRSTEDWAFTSPQDSLHSCFGPCPNQSNKTLGAARTRTRPNWQLAGTLVTNFRACRLVDRAVKHTIPLWEGISTAGLAFCDSKNHSDRSSRC